MKLNRFLRSFLALAGSSLLVVSSVNATQYWDGTGLDANWNTPENWGGDVIPDWNQTINFGSLSSAAGTAFGDVVVPSQTTANNNLTAGTTIKNITFGNDGQVNRTDAYTLQGNSIVLGTGTNDTISTTALHGSAIVSSIEDVITLDIDLGSPGGAQNRQFLARGNHHLKIDGVISGGANAVVLVRVSDATVTFTNANNSYLGATNIAEALATNAGESVLEITSIANGGSNSSIGASSNAAGNLRFNSGFNETDLTTLRYIGATDASTDRLFTMSGNAKTSTGIESSGAGTLSFTNTGALASDRPRERNLYLGGTNTGDNTFAPTLADYGDANNLEKSSLIKQGAGKWILTGDHSYTGATTISDGTLEISGGGDINQTSGVIIASGATFRYNSSVAYTGGAITNNGGTIGGTGDIGVAVALNSTSYVLSPGNSPGIQEYTVGQSWESFTYEWETNDFDGTTAGTHFDQIQITGALALTGILPGNYVLDLVSLAGLVAGNVADFSEITTSWDIITTTGGLTGFDADTWTIDDTAFTSSPAWAGAWSLSATSNNLVLTYTAVPEPSAALLSGLGLIALLRRRR